MQGLYRAILSLYPAEYQAVFAPEMIAVFKQTSIDLKRKGILTFILFAISECMGLLKGVVVEHTARWSTPDTYITPRCTSWEDLGNQTETVAGERRLEQLIRSMEFAIAHHDFPKARFYSNEERTARALLEQLVKSEKVNRMGVSRFPGQ